MGCDHGRFSKILSTKTNRLGGAEEYKLLNFKKCWKVKCRTGPAQWSSGSGRGSDDGSLTITGTLTLTLVM